MNNENNKETEYEEIDLKKIIGALLRKRNLIIKFVAVFVSLALVYSFVAPKVFKIESALEVGSITNLNSSTRPEVIEDPVQVKDKIDKDVYGYLIRQKLDISRRDYPSIKTQNLKNTDVISLYAESSKPDQVKLIFDEINALIIGEHKQKIDLANNLLEKEIDIAENDSETIKKNIERLRVKIASLNEEKANMENKVAALEKVLVYQQDPGTQFAHFDAKEKLESKRQEIENRYLEINSLEQSINALDLKIAGLKGQMEQNKLTRAVKEPTISEQPIKPRPLLNSAAALLLGLFTGVLWAFAADWWKK